MAGADDPHANKRRRSLTNPLGLIMGAVVPNVVDAIDVDDVVAQVDVDALIARVDLDALVAGIDLDAVIARVDVDAIANRVDIDALLARMNVDAFLARVDIDAFLARVDVDAFLARVDIDTFLARMNVDQFLARVDVAALSQRLDLDELLARMDINAVVGRVNMDELLARVDLDSMIDRVDIDHIMQRADIAGIVAQSTRGITANTLDLVRRQLVGIDELVTRVAARLARRDPDTDPDSPPALRAAPVSATPPSVRPSRTGPSISGHYSGPLARLAALAIDIFASMFLFGLGTALGSWTIDLLFDRHGDAKLNAPWSAMLLAVWLLTYYTVPLAATGRTLGKAIVGLRVVTSEGHPLRPYQALVRVLVMPFSFALFGLGTIGTVFGRRRRALHDVVAGSAEVIDWGDRTAALPSPINNWLEQRNRRHEHDPNTASAA